MIESIIASITDIRDMKVTYNKLFVAGAITATTFYSLISELNRAEEFRFKLLFDINKTVGDKK